VRARRLLLAVGLALVLNLPQAAHAIQVCGYSYSGSTRFVGADGGTDWARQSDQPVFGVQPPGRPARAGLADLAASPHLRERRCRRALPVSPTTDPSDSVAPSRVSSRKPVLYSARAVLSTDVEPITLRVADVRPVSSQPDNPLYAALLQEVGGPRRRAVVDGRPVDEAAFGERPVEWL
jgi:hypothetical protein